MRILFHLSYFALHETYRHKGGFAHDVTESKSLLTLATNISVQLGCSENTSKMGKKTDV